MIYKVKNPQDKEWNQKKFVEAYLQAFNAIGELEGEEFKVSFWNGEISDADGMYKDTVEGILEKNDKGYWKLVTAKKAVGGNFMETKKLENQTKIEEIRNKHIQENMHSKEESIAWFNSRNTALEFVKTYVCNPAVSAPSEALESIQKYTKIFHADWANWDNQPF